MRSAGNHGAAAAHLRGVGNEDTAVTDVRIAHVEPRPGRLPDGTFRIGRFLVVLADDSGGRAMPVWLTVPDGGSLWRLLGSSASPGGQASGPGGADTGSGLAGVPEETAGRLLQAAGATVTAVEIDVTGPGSDDPGPAGTSARIAIAGPGGTRHVTAFPGYGLTLAAVTGAPVKVASAVVDRLAQPLRGDDLPGQFLPPAAARPVALRGGSRWRFEPRNLAFADGLDRWDLDGSFLRQDAPSRRQDYACSADSGAAVLWSAVPQPHGSAELGQTIFADDYLGATITFRGELDTEGAAGQAGLFLRFHSGGPHQPVDRDDTRRSPEASGSTGWAWREISAEVPGHTDVITFGVFLGGRGRVRMRGTELTRGA